ncbi:MAG: hypothetical protein ACXVDN_11555 [Ktedonobacteraceae bacterium]
MGFHETVPPRAVRRSTGGRYRLQQGRRYSPPVEADSLYAQRSFIVALMATLHAEHYKNIHFLIITLPVWPENATTVRLFPPLETTANDRCVEATDFSSLLAS